MNNSKIFSDTVKIVEWVRFDKKGKKAVTPRNQYLLSIADKALKLNIGSNFVISRQWKNTTYDYMGTDDKTHSFEDLRNNINESALLNLFTSINLFLSDRQLCFYYNKDEQLTVQILPASATAKTIYVYDKDCGIESTRDAYNDITGELIRVTTKSLKNTRVLVGDFSKLDCAGDWIEKAKKDLTEIKKNLDNADLFYLCTPKAMKVEGKKRSEKTA